MEGKLINLDGKSVFVRKPRKQDLENAERVYNTKVAELIRNNDENQLLTRSELEKFLEARAFYTNEDLENITSTQKTIIEGLEKLKKGGITLKEGRQICLDISDARRSLVDILSRRQSYDFATIESVAEFERDKYLVFLCVYTEDNDERYWMAPEDMTNDDSVALYDLAHKYITHQIYGVDENLDKSLPENKWLLKYGFVDENLYFIDRKTGVKTDRSGKEVANGEEGEKLDDDLSFIDNPEEPFVDEDV